MITFSEKVYAVVADIPKGKTMTYKEVAVRAGNPRACRAVGNILNKNYDPSIPCHRVVCSNGTPGGYNRGKKEKVRKLVAEGVHHTAPLKALPILYSLRSLKFRSLPKI